MHYNSLKATQSGGFFLLQHFQGFTDSFLRHTRVVLLFIVQKT